jgi:hypothetical protein
MAVSICALYWSPSEDQKMTPGICTCCRLQANATIALLDNRISRISGHGKRVSKINGHPIVRALLERNA